MENSFEEIANIIRKIDDDIDALMAKRYKIMQPLIISEPLASNIDTRDSNIAKIIEQMENAGSKILYCQPGFIDGGFDATVLYDVYYITPSGKFAYSNVDSHTLARRSGIYQ